MIYDCFLFFNELDLLEIRLNILTPYVDKFVLVEMDRTHSNEKKILFFEENKKRFNQFLDKIIYIKVSDYPTEYKNAWTFENYHRNMIHEGIKNCKEDDIIIISDLDEIPDNKNIINYKNNKYRNELICLNQNVFCYFLNYKNISNFSWHGSKIVSYSTYKKYNLTPQIIRDNKTCRIIKNGGWHFTYLGGYEKIIYKIKSFAHQEFNNDKFLNETIKKKMEKGQDLFNNKNCHFIPIKPTSKSLPEFINKNHIQYHHLIYKEINIFRNIFKYITKKPYYLLKSLYSFIKKLIFNKSTNI